MKSFLVLITLLIVGIFGSLLALGFFGIVNLQHIYMDVVGFTNGIDFDTYRSTRILVEIRHPNDWNINESILDDKIEILARDSQTAKVVARFKIEKIRPEMGFVFDEFVESQINAVKRNKKQYRRIDQREVVLDGRRAVQLTYTYLDEGKELQVKHFWMLQQANVYSLQYQAELSNVEGTWEIMDMMLQSFNLLDPNQIPQI